MGMDDLMYENAMLRQQLMYGGKKKNKFTQMHLPPATKSALKSVGKYGVSEASRAAQVLVPIATDQAINYGLSQMYGSGRRLNPAEKLLRAKAMYDDRVKVIQDEMKEKMKKKGPKKKLPETLKQWTESLKKVRAEYPDLSYKEQLAEAQKRWPSVKNMPLEEEVKPKPKRGREPKVVQEPELVGSGYGYEWY